MDKQATVDLMNEMEKQIIETMDKETYEEYMNLPRDTRFSIVFTALKETKKTLTEAVNQ